MSLAILVSGIVTDSKPTRTSTFTVPAGDRWQGHFHGRVLGRDGLNGWFREITILDARDTTPWWARLIPWLNCRQYTVKYDIAFRTTIENYEEYNRRSMHNVRE